MSTLGEAGSAAGFVGRRVRELLRTYGVVGSAVHFVRSAPFAPRRLRGLLREASYDRKMGVQTSPLVAATELGIESDKLQGVATNAHGNAYMPTPAWALAAILQELNISFPDYTFIDLGSGMGRAVLIAAEFPFAKVVGVEFSPDLHRIAQENLSRREQSRRAAAVELFCRDARDYAFSPGNTVVYMFNPFQEAVMTTVLTNLRRTFETQTADLIVVYFNPVLENLLDALPFLIKLKAAGRYSTYCMRPRAASHPDVGRI